MQDIVVKCGGSNKEETEIAPAFKMLGWEMSETCIWKAPSD